MVIEDRKSTHFEFSHKTAIFNMFVNFFKYFVDNPEMKIDASLIDILNFTIKLVTRKIRLTSFHDCHEPKI